jgi:NCAIR mutase (PurE)-related protein
MTTVLAAGAVDWNSLGKVVAASLIAGVGVTLCFSFAVAGATRFAEFRRDHRSGVAALYAIVGLAGLAATVASVVIGIAVMTKKS